MGRRNTSCAHFPYESLAPVESQHAQTTSITCSFDIDAMLAMLQICTTFHFRCTPHLAHRKRQRPGRRPDDNPTLPYATVRSARLHRYRCRQRAEALSRHSNINKYQRNSHPAMVAVIFNTGCLRGEVDGAEAVFYLLPIYLRSLAFGFYVFYHFGG